jgi:hypothetical protein
MTPFFKASRKGHPEAMMVLLDFGATKESLAQSSALVSKGGHMAALPLFSRHHFTEDRLFNGLPVLFQVRDMHANKGAMRALLEPTQDGRDYVFSKALGRRYRML